MVFWLSLLYILTSSYILVLIIPKVLTLLCISTMINYYTRYYVAVSSFETKIYIRAIPLSI